MIACYCRAPARHQKHESQKAEIMRWLKHHRVPVVCSAVVRRYETGMTLKRRAFERLQHAIFEGTIRTVVVWKLDRPSRRQCEGVNLPAAWCERRVRLVVVTQQLDLSGVVGTLVASVLFGLAEIEQEYRLERQAAGIAVASETGHTAAGGRARPRRTRPE
jgi:DNA invertase Pin-like site-specific DNA recombinase